MKAKEFLFEEVLMEEIKLNKLSSKLGKIIIQIINSNTDNSDRINTIISVLKRIRKEIVQLENRYYEKKITGKQIEKHVSLYIKAITKIIKELEDTEIKRKKNIIKSLSGFIKELKKIKRMVK